MIIGVRRILLTGMSGTGKSTLIRELASRGFKAIDLDSDLFSEWVEVPPNTSQYALPGPDRDWVWREGRVQDLLAEQDSDVLFVSGCAQNMKKFFAQFDRIILLSAPADVIKERLRARADHKYGTRPQELAQVLELMETVEPLLRRKADHVLITTVPVHETVAEVLSLAG